jgi:hypothetical protein
MRDRRIDTKEKGEFSENALSRSIEKEGAIGVEGRVLVFRQRRCKFWK